MQSGTKGLWLSLIISFFSLLVFFKRAAFPFLRTQFFLIITAVLMDALLFQWLPLLTGHSTGILQSVNDYLAASHVSVSSRFYLWQQAWKMIVSHLALGVGPLHYAYYPNGIGAHPHNSLLMIASEWGVPVALFILFLAVWGFYSWCRYVQRTPSPVHMALTVSLSATLLYSLVSGVIVMPLSQLMLGLLIGWTIGHYFFGQAPNKIPLFQQLIYLSILFLN